MQMKTNKKELKNMEQYSDEKENNINIISNYQFHRIIGKRSLLEEIPDIFVHDYKLTCSMIKTRGLIFVIALIIVNFIAILKVFHCIFTYFADEFKPKIK